MKVEFLQGTTLSHTVPDGTVLHVHRWLPDGRPRAVVQVVQPRFEPPDTTNFVMARRPPSGVCANACTVSIARTAALVIGKRASQRSSPPSRNFRQP